MTYFFFYHLVAGFIFFCLKGEGITENFMMKENKFFAVSSTGRGKRKGHYQESVVD
jgi:hypothetical protein